MTRLCSIFLLFSIKIFCLNWTNPITIDVIGNSSMVATDSSGNAIAVWLETNYVYASRLPYGQLTWSTPVAISGFINQLSEAPAIAMNDSGQAIVVWANSDTNQIQMATTTTGVTTWSSPQDVMAGWYAPQCAINASGYAVIASAKTNDDAGMTTATVTWGGSPSSPILINEGSDTPDFSIGIDDSGNALMVYTDVQDSLFGCYLANGGGSWVVTLLDTGQQFNTTPGLAVDSLGNATAAWPIKSVGLRMSKFTSGGTWSTASTIGPTTMISVIVAVADSLNNVTIIFTTGSVYGEPALLQSIFIPYGSSPEAVQTIDQLTYPGALSMAASTDPGNNNVYILYQNGIASGVEFAKVETAVLPYLGTWSTPRTLSSRNKIISSSVSISSSKTNYAVATWTSSNNTVSQSVISAIGKTVTEAPPTNLQGNQVLHRFVTQGDLINQLSWTPPVHVPEKYNIYRNSLSNLIGSNTVPFYQDHQRKKGVSDTYYVTAVDGTTESSAISITLP